MDDDASMVMQRLVALEQRVAEFEVKDAIRDVLFRYCRATDRLDVELLKSCYFDDATDCHWFFNGNAHDFCDFIVNLHRQSDNTVHSITNTMIDLAPDAMSAFVESQFYAMHRIPLGDGRYLDQVGDGRYLDVFEQREGEWKIAHRRVAFEGFRESVVADVLGGNPGLGRRAPDDPVYLGREIIDEPLQPVPGFDLLRQAKERYR